MNKASEYVGVVVLGLFISLGCVGLFGCASSSPRPVGAQQAELEGNTHARDASGNTYEARVVGVNHAGTLVIAKRSPSGRTLWTQAVQGGARSTIRQGIAIDSRGNVLVVWSVQGGAERLVDAWVRKYDPEGNVLWTRTWDGARGADFGERVAVCDDGTVIVRGRSYAGEGHFAPFTARWDEAGNEIDDRDHIEVAQRGN